MTVIEAILIGLLAVGPVVTWARTRRLGLALGAASMGSDRSSRSALVDEIVAAVRSAQGPDGRLHSHDVEVIARRCLKGRRP